MIALASAPAAKGLPATSARAPLEPILNTDTVFALPLAVSTNCPLGSMATATEWALVENGLPVTAVSFRLDGSIRYPLISPELEATYRKRFLGSIATADGVGPSGKGLPAIGVGTPVFGSVVRVSMVPVVAFVTASRVALVGGGGGGGGLPLPSPPPPPQPQASAQSIAQKTPRTSD